MSVDAGLHSQDLPFVSVLIPTYRNRDGVEAAVRSVLACDYPPDRFEIIVTDGSSGDGTMDRLAEVEAEYPGRVRGIELQPFGGGASRNEGLKHSRGEVLAFLDSDCAAADENWLSAGVQALLADPEVGWIQGRTEPPPDAALPTRARYVSVTGADAAHHYCNLFLRREAFEAVGGFSEDYYFDVEKARKSWLIKVFPALFRIAFLLRCSTEDTDLGWRLIDAGWRKGYCDEARAYHEVRILSPFWWIIDTGLYCSGVPRLAKRHRGLRRHLFLGHFLTKPDAWFTLLVAGCVAAVLVHPAALLLAAPYVWSRASEPSKFWRGPLRLLRFLFYLPRDAATFAILLYRSLKYRYVVL